MSLLVDVGGRTTVTGATRAKQVLHREREREGSVVARAQQERDRELWKDGSKDEFRIQFRGGVGPQVMQSNSQILKYIRPIHPALCHTRTRRPQLVGDGVITTFMPRSSLCPWPKLCSLSLCLSASCSPPFTISRPPSATVCSLARFQVNQRQIQGRAQPNFGPPCKRWGWPPFYLSRNGRPLTIGLSASDGSS